MTSELVTAPGFDDAPSILEKAAIVGDLSKLQPIERLRYYHAVCQSLGLNPLTKPFQYLTLNGRLTLYATKDCTDQLRSLKSISIISAERDATDRDYATWVVSGTDGRGRTDIDIGSVLIAGLKGEARANATMKALTKAKRRLTLSLAGLGMLDETEIDHTDGQRVRVNPETGEVIPMSRAQEMLLDRARASRTAQDGPQSSELTEDTTEDIPATVTSADVSVEVVEDEAPATARDICGEVGPDAYGPCTRAPGHPAGHRSDKGAWPKGYRGTTK